MMRKNHSAVQLGFYSAEWLKIAGPDKRGPKKTEDSNSGPEAGNRGVDKRDEAAKKFGIGGRTVSKAANVLDKGCKQLQQAVRDGLVHSTLAVFHYAC